MNMFIFVSIAALIAGLIIIGLIALNRLPSYRTWLIIGALLLFAIAIGAYLFHQSRLTEPSSVTAQSLTPTRQEADNLPISPIAAPISPVSTPQLPITEVPPSEIGFKGCLLFTSSRTNDLEIFEVQQSLDDARQLTNSPGLDIDPAWSPDGKQIAFASNREPDTGFQIYTMNSDGSNQQRVGPIQPGDNTHPSWSPDSRQLVFQSKRDLNGNLADDNNDIYLMNSDGTEANLLVVHSADNTEPVWSADGQKIAFLSERSGQDEVYLVDPDGANITQLTTLDVLKSGLKWAIDGQHILFEGSGDIYSVDVVTREITKLVSLEDSNQATPLWTQNNELLIFSSDRTGNWELYALSSRNSTELELAQLTDNPAVDLNPSWFPCDQ